MLVMEDMKTEANPVLAPAGYYPHHNLYFMISRRLGSSGPRRAAALESYRTAGSCVLRKDAGWYTTLPSPVPAQGQVSSAR